MRTKDLFQVAFLRSQKLKLKNLEKLGIRLLSFEESHCHVPHLHFVFSFF